MNDEIRLVRAAGGLLRVPTDAEEQEHEARTEERAKAKDGAKVERKESRIAELEIAIVEALLAAQAPVTSREDLVALVPGTQAEKETAVSRLLTSRRINGQPPAAKGEKATYSPSNHYESLHS